MSATPEYEAAARQDYGPTTSNEHVYEHILEHKLADNMNIPSIRTPVLRPVPVSPNEGDPEPDSTNPESLAHSSLNIEKEVEYHITEARCNTGMVESLPGIVRIEEATLDNVERIAYPVLQESTDLNDGTYVENSSAIIQPLNTAIVQNVTKLPQNFTFNVDATVSNLTSLQNVSTDVTGSSQTLWLPTILATSAPADKTEDDRSQAGMSQILITSESFVASDVSQAGPRRANILTETSFISRSKASKVQILSNISLPKNQTYSQQYIQGSKELTAPVYSTNHVYKLNANLVSHKHMNNSVLCSTKTSKNQSLIGCSSLSPVVNSPTKNSYSHSLPKGTNVNKTQNKVNNGANLNAVVAASSGNSHHILSRVVSGPNKLSVHSGRKSNSVKGSKSGGSMSGGNQKQSRAIKIIQQTGTVHKTDTKNWPVANVTTYKSQQPTFGVIDSNNKIIPKMSSPTHKSQQPIALQKVAKGERLVLQSPCGPVLISTAPLCTSLPKGPHYVQSGLTPNLRYVQTYGTTANPDSNISQVSANQQLTAQILQSLSQPKVLLPALQTPTVINHTLNAVPMPEEPMEVKPINQKRIVFGDPTTLLTADDIIGMEERPNLTEEIRRYPFQALALVMLDHTYSLPSQKLPSPPIVTPVTTAAAVPTIVSPTIVSTPVSPLKRSPPIVTHTATYDLQPLTTIPASIIGMPIVPVSTITTGTMTFKPQAPPPLEDDAASMISSVEGDKERQPGDRAGSDTETAPENEDEGKTRCICDFTHDDGYMICCDRCGEWQHVDCMGIDRQNIPDSYMCDLCMPRPVDRRHARAIQQRKREELHAIGAASDTDSDADLGRMPGQRRKRLLTVTTYTNTTGSCVTTYNAGVPSLPPLPTPTLSLPKRGPKRPKKTEIIRKGTKRKLSEKRVKRKKEMMMNRSKYSSSSLTSSQTSHWQESYELAVTNHYSPELRAKIMKYSSRLGNTANMASAITAHLCTTVPHAGGKILIATKDLRENTPVIELRGKYMLSNQHRPQLQNLGRAGSQKPGPFVFFYRLPKDNTQICIDTRTYGNEARFARRSCKPNAELQHCIVKGTLHVYLVTTSTIQSNTEITVGHDSNGGKQPCACGNPKHCKLNGLSTPTLAARKCIDYLPREKRSRNRTASISSPVSPPPVACITTPIKDTPLSPKYKSEKKSPIKLEFSPMSPVKSAVVALNFDKPIKEEIKEEEDPEMDLTAKEEMKPEDIDEPDFAVKHEFPPVEEIPLPPLPPSPTPSPEELKMEIDEHEHPTHPQEEETKPEKIEEAKSEELVTIPEPEPIIPEKTESKDELFSDEEKLEMPKEEALIEEERPVSREATAKSACHDRSARSSRTNTCTNQDSLDDKTDDSQDKLLSSIKEKDKRKMTREERKMEAIMKAFERMEKAEQRKQEVKERQKRRESDPHPNTMEKDDEEELQCSTKRRRRRKGRARTTSQSNRRRLNSADSDMVTSGDEAPLLSPRAPSRRDSAPNHHTPSHDSDRSISEDLGLSSACLLVEAAVGSVESAFKLPKTKKTMATEWVGRSPERTPSPYRSPYRPSLVNAPSLESLVRVASTIIGDLSGGHSEVEDNISPPRTPGRDRSRPPKKSKRITRSTTDVVDIPEVTPISLPQHSAKKRWLRQAISEESDSPNTESPPSEMITPLKKRRLARESISCEQNTVPCTDEASPILTSEDSPVKDNRQSTVRNIMEGLYRDRTRSDSGQGSDDQCNMDHDILNVNLKVPHDSENIRRIIGVPGPEDEPPAITKIEDIKTFNNNLLENTACDESNYNKVVPMDIDTTITPHLHIKDAEPELKRTESPLDKLNSSQSADTSGNSSPQRDEMDDIQKKIHSFHTENIMILKSRNKKPPKEKRKKVNLNFDLNMVDDQISIQLRSDTITSPDVNGEVHEDSDKMSYMPPEFIPLPPVESIPLPPVDTIPLPPVETIPLPPVDTIPLPAFEIQSSAVATKSPSPKSERTSPVVQIIERKQDSPKTVPAPIVDVQELVAEEPSPVTALRPTQSESPPQISEKPESPKPIVEKPLVAEKPSVLESTVPFSSRFSTTGLFSGIFNNMSQSFNSDNQINDNVPNMQIIKSAIDRTTSLDKSIFDKDSITQVDDLKSVQEILTRVNNMDSNNSVLLSGVLKSSDTANKPCSLLSGSPKPTVKPYCPRSNDPRLNPPLADKPKPVRRKLSITEYRKRLKGPSTEAEPNAGAGGEGAAGVGEWSSESSNAGSLSPLRLDLAVAAASDDLEQRLHRALNTAHVPKAVFDAQPTASERQRENLSSRLRREFGLALPDDEEARPATDAGASTLDPWEHSNEGFRGFGPTPPPAAAAAAAAPAPPVDAFRVLRSAAQNGASEASRCER